MLFFDNRRLDQLYLPDDFRRHVEQIYSPVAYRTAGRDARMEKVDFVLGEGSANIPVVARLAHANPIVGLVAGAAVSFGIDEGLDQMNRMMV